MITTKIIPLIFGGLVVGGTTTAAIFIPKLVKKDNPTNGEPSSS